MSRRTGPGTSYGRLGVNLEWREPDAEVIPFSDDEFDNVISCVGVMFAPHHQASADELVRACRPGGTIGIINWARKVPLASC